MTVPYLPPVDRLLKLGAEPARRRSWPDYRNLGLEHRHAPTLIQMATDPALHGAEERNPAIWAPVHAWRALAQLRAAAAAGPLLALLEREVENEWVYSEIPVVLGMIGPPALPGATMLLFDEGRTDELRLAAAAAIVGVGLDDPERRDEAAALVTKQLEDWPHQSKLLNSYLIEDLVLLEDTAAAPLIEAVFAGGGVNPAFCGDWEDVQVGLGLLPERLTEPAYADEPGRRAGATRPPSDAAAKAKARRKAEKEARKRNRKKK